MIILSGGFDPIHKGHVRMFKEASLNGTLLLAGLNSDQWLIRKKGKFFMPFVERKEILESIRYIDLVKSFNDSDVFFFASFFFFLLFNFFSSF